MGVIKIVFENPNTPEETVSYLAKILAQRIAVRENERRKMLYEENTCKENECVYDDENEDEYCL